VPATTLPTPTDDPFEGLSQLFGGQQLDFVPVATVEALQASEAFVSGGQAPVRCIVIEREGARSWFRCMFTDVPAGFVIVDGADPWWVDVGPVAGQVTLTKQPASWTLLSNGCVDPIAQIVAAAESTAGAFSGVACGGASALLTYQASSGDRQPFDSGGVLVVRGDEGWNDAGGGSSMACPFVADGADPCSDLGAGSDLLEAMLPIPPPAFLPPQEMAVNLLDLTVEADAMAFGAPDLDAAGSLIAASIEDPTLGAAVIRHDFGPLSVIVAEAPAQDDSIRSTTWAVWFDVPPDGSPPSVRHGFVWTNCGRGVSGGLCV
jgi:hypothetical protein